MDAPSTASRTSLPTMGRTLLIGNPRVTWREWLRDHRGKRDLLCLDPSDPAQEIPARLALFRGEYPIRTRFYGSLDPQRAPHVLVGALAAAMPRMGEDAIVQLFAYRPSPLMRQVAMLLAQTLAPSRIVVAEGTELDMDGWPVGPEKVELEENFPPMVQHAQRKAQWLRLIEECGPHDVDLRSVTLEGSRLGSGKALGSEERTRAGLRGAVHAERCGKSLLVVSPEDPDDGEVARALDVTGCAKAQFVHPGEYTNLLCAFARESGEEIGMGIVQSIDWEARRLQALCTAVPPAPVKILRLGSLRVDPNGRELGEGRPWQL